MQTLLTHLLATTANTTAIATSPDEPNSPQLTPSVPLSPHHQDERVEGRGYCWYGLL